MSSGVRFALKNFLFVSGISSVVFFATPTLFAQANSQDAVAEIPAEVGDRMDSEVRIVDLKDLDLEIFKERLRKSQGEFARLNTTGTWQVAYQGKTEEWKWTPKGWTCPKTASIKCGDWVPLAFRWWPSVKAARGWFEKWKPTKLEGFSLSNESHDKRATEVKAQEAGAANGEASPELDAAETKLFEGNRMATQLSTWAASGASEAKIGISLKSGWVAFIDYSGIYERLAWKLPAQQTIPELERVLMEKDGTQVTFLRIGK